MIDRGSVRGLYEHDHELHAYCPRWDRWRVLDLAGMVAAGIGYRRLPLAVRCQNCGERGRLQVRPPVQTIDPHQRGWMEPH